MADAPDLGSGAARCGGSSPLSRTIQITRSSGMYLKVFLSYISNIIFRKLVRVEDFQQLF